MPATLIEPSAALTARYRLERVEEWDMLLRRLRSRDKFAFLPLFAPEDAGVEIARRAFAAWAEENSVPLVFHTLLPDGPIDSLTRLLIDELQNPDAIHWIQATPLDPAGDKETQLAARWHDPVAALNSRRNSLQQTLRAPLIFAAPEELSPYLRDHAVDLWDIRGLSTYLPPPEAEPSGGAEFQPMGSGLAIPGDPDFTLGLAHELEGQPDRAEERAALLSRAGRQALFHWDFPRAESLLRESLRLSEEIGSRPEILWQREDHLSQILRHSGQFAEALSHAENARTFAEAAYGPHSSAFAISLNNLAGLLQEHGKLAEAELLYRRSLAIDEARLGSNHPDVAASLNNLAELYRNQGKLEEAEPLYLRSLEIAEAILGKDHPNVGRGLNNLALLLDDLGRLGEAEALYRRALGISEAKLGKNHPDVASTLNNLAFLLEVQGKLVEAESFFRRALEINEAKLGEYHPMVATCLNNLAGLLRSQGRLTEAEPLYWRALEISERKLDKYHPDVATSLNNLAGLLRAQGKLTEAESYYRRALGIILLHRKLNGMSHPHEQAAIDNYTLLLEAMGRTPDQIREEIEAMRREAGLEG